MPPVMVVVASLKAGPRITNGKANDTMGTFSIWHWLIVLAVVLILFGGKGKISQLMGDVGKGLKAFKKGMNQEGNLANGDDAKVIETEASAAARSETEKDKAASG